MQVAPSQLMQLPILLTQESLVTPVVVIIVAVAAVAVADLARTSVLPSIRTRMVTS
jgi:hypothetical protein